MDDLICVRCNKPVKNSKDYELFEKMHWTCFHFEFEHLDADPDEPCSDPSCPWGRIVVLEKAVALGMKLSRLLESEDQVSARGEFEAAAIESGGQELESI